MSGRGGRELDRSHNMKGPLTLAGRYIQHGSSIPTISATNTGPFAVTALVGELILTEVQQHINGANGVREAARLRATIKLRRQFQRQTITAACGNDTINGGSNSSDETLNGDAGNDTLDGRDGNDNVNGGAGDDTILHAIGDDDDNIDGGADTDTVRMRRRRHANATC